MKVLTIVTEARMYEDPCVEMHPELPVLTIFFIMVTSCERKLRGVYHSIYIIVLGDSSNQCFIAVTVVLWDDY